MGHKSPSAIAYWQRALASNQAANTPSGMCTAETLANRRAVHDARTEGTHSRWPTLPKSADGYSPRREGTESAGQYNWRSLNKNLGGRRLASRHAILVVSKEQGQMNVCADVILHPSTHTVVYRRGHCLVCGMRLPKAGQPA